MQHAWKLARMSLDVCNRDRSNIRKTHILMVTRSLLHAPYTVQVVLVVHLDTYVLYLKTMVTNSYLYIALPVHSDHMWQLLMIEYFHRNLWWRTLSQSTTQHRTWLDVQHQWLWYRLVNLVLIREAGSVSTSEKIISKVEKICGKEI